MKTRAEKVSDGYRLTGSKMWISNAPIADVFVVWAKSAAPTTRFAASSWRRDEGSLGAKDQGEAFATRLDHRRDRDGRRGRAGSALLPNVSGLKGPFGCLNRARYGISWGAMGADEGLLSSGPAVRARPQAVRPAARRHAIDPEEARRHADGDRARFEASLQVGRLRMRAGWRPR